MGYRSQVGIVLKKEVFHKHETHLKEIFKDCDTVEKDSNAFFFKWDSVKWYEDYEDANGVLVTNVERYSAAEEGRIVRGDLIVKIEDIPVESVSDYRKAIKSFKKGQVVIFYLKRRSREVHAFVKLPE